MPSSPAKTPATGWLGSKYVGVQAAMAATRQPPAAPAPRVAPPPIVTDPTTVDPLGGPGSRPFEHVPRPPMLSPGDFKRQYPTGLPDGRLPNHQLWDQAAADARVPVTPLDGPGQPYDGDMQRAQQRQSSLLQQQQARQQVRSLGALAQAGRQPMAPPPQPPMPPRSLAAMAPGAAAMRQQQHAAMRQQQGRSLAQLATPREPMY
jgi:hypothetical protein